MLRETARWLSSQRVTHVAMEATAIYSMPVYHALLEHAQFTQVLVCNAAHVKTSRAAKPTCGRRVAGPAAGVRAAAGQLHPARRLKAARDVIRYRPKVVQSRTSEPSGSARAPDAGIKLDSVASSLTTSPAWR